MLAPPLHTVAPARTCRRLVCKTSLSCCSSPLLCCTLRCWDNPLHMPHVASRNSLLPFSNLCKGNMLPFGAFRKGRAGRMKGRSNSECSSCSGGSMCTPPSRRPSGRWMLCQRICLGRSTQHLMTCGSLIQQVTLLSHLISHNSCTSSACRQICSAIDDLRLTDAACSKCLCVSQGTLSQPRYSQKYFGIALSS